MRVNCGVGQYLARINYEGESIMPLTPGGKVGLEVNVPITDSINIGARGSYRLAKYRLEKDDTFDFDGSFDFSGLEGGLAVEFNF